MQNLHVEFSFKGKARLNQMWNLASRGKVFTFLREIDILQIWRQYNDQKKLEEQQRKPKAP
jgi:hypothetical protein